MAGEARTIRVRGLPVGWSENRLIDKIQIHFLRKKNGGGDISSVAVSKTMPGTAFITFEESEVALRLAQRGKQVFKINDKIYDISISLHHEEADVDKVLLRMSVLVDHKKLPEGKKTLLSLHESFPGVCLTFDDQKDLYTLTGRYSEVQSLSSLVLGSLEKQDQRSGDKPQPKTESKKTYNSPLEESANSHVKSASEVKSGVVKHTVLSEDLNLNLESKNLKAGLPLPSSYSNRASHADLTEDKWDLAADIGTSLEDFSLIVDSDIFRYIHTYCSKEYQSILKQNHVEVLDVNCDDITTLYLKPKTALSGHDISSVKKAHQGLAYLYQQEESQLRKEHVYKCGIPEKELTYALECLRKRLPRLMINKEDRNVYMVGSKSDVCEAKQFICSMQGFGTEKKIHSDLLCVPSQSKKQGSSASSEPSGIFPQSFQDSHDIFMPRKVLQDTNQRGIPTEISSKKRHSSVESKKFNDHSHTGQFTFPVQRIEKSTEDPFDFRRTEGSQDRHVPSDLKWMEPGSWPDRYKDTDSFFESSKPSAPYFVLDINEKSFDKADFSSETTELESHLDTSTVDSEKQIKSSKGYKTKQTESGKERKMAANFTKEMCSGNTDLTSYNLEAPKLVGGAYVQERKFPESFYSLPLITPSMNTHLDLSALRSTNAKTSTSKTDIQVKSDMSKLGHFPYDKKPTMATACLSGGQDDSTTMPSGSALRRSSSLSDRMKKGEETVPMSVDLSAGQKGTSQNSLTREIITMELVLPFRLWLYLTSVYKTEIDNLTSDLQVKDKLVGDNITLCLKGIDSGKVSECHRALNSLIAKAEMDFEARTVPLSKLGVSDSKDKTLLELCTSVKQHYKMVKILVMSNDMVILGPKPLCDKVEAMMINVFHKGGDIANSKQEDKKHPNPYSIHSSKAPHSDLKLFGNQSTASAKPHTDIIMKDLAKRSDQSVASSSKTIPQVLTNQEQDDESRSQNKMKEELEQLNKKGPTLMQGDSGTMNNENGETSSGSVINSTTKDKADGENNSNHTSTTAQSKEAFIKQMNPGISVDQIRDSQGSPEVSEPKNEILPSRNQNLLLCYVCEKEYSTVKQTACGYNFCPTCEKEAHNNCRTCATAGIKGTMSVQESTITIHGFNRDTTLKITYDIPDGIQGDDHPCPGAPFKGNRFEAFLPHNKHTEKLLPLLKKAFHEGLTFTVKEGSSDDDGSIEGIVVWGSIPHKTRTEGGASRNGYPDFGYIRRLEEALKIAGVK